MSSERRGNWINHLIKYSSFTCTLLHKPVSICSFCSIYPPFLKRKKGRKFKGHFKSHRWLCWLQVPFLLQNSTSVTTLLSSVGPSIMYFHNSLVLYMCAQLKNHQLNQNLLGLARFDKINKAQKIDNTASYAKFYIFSTCSIKIWKLSWLFRLI